MNETIICCAGCGKRFKGVGGNKKFKCSGCQNVFTFPVEPREPGYGKTLCSNCWSEFDWSESISACPTCTQKVSPSHGARAIRWAAGSSLAPYVGPDDHTKLAPSHDADARIAELTAQLTAMRESQSNLQMELTNTRADADARLDDLRRSLEASQNELDTRNAEVINARSELDQYRALAVTALEPLSVDFTRRMREMISETDKLRASVKQTREDFALRFEKLERSGSDLREKLSAACSEINEKLSEVLGVEPDKGEVVEDPRKLPEGTLAELLAAGIPITGAAIVMTRHSKG